MRKHFYTITGKVEAVSEREAYQKVWRNLVVDGRCIHLSNAAMLVRPEPQVGDTVTVECFDRKGEDGEVFICGASVKVLKETCLTCRWSYIEEGGDMYCSRTGNLVYSDDGCFGGYEKEEA